MPVALENRKVGAAIGERLHILMGKLNLKGQKEKTQNFCERISLPYTTLSTLKEGTKLLNAVNLYYLVKEYPETDLYWLLTGEKRSDNNLSVQSEKTAQTASISVEEQLVAARQEIAFLRAQNELLNRSILNLTNKL